MSCVFCSEIVYDLCLFLHLGTNLIDASFEIPLNATLLESQVNDQSQEEYTVIDTMLPDDAENLRFTFLLHVQGLIAGQDLTLFENALKTTWAGRIPGGTYSFQQFDHSIQKLCIMLTCLPASVKIVTTDMSTTSTGSVQHNLNCFPSMSMFEW